MNSNEIQRLAHAVNDLRPDWPISSLTTFITRELSRRTYRDAAVALVWVATDTKTNGEHASEKPSRVVEAGPWWRAAAVENPSELTPVPPRREEACRTCGRHLNSCICGEQATRPTPPAAPEAVEQALAAARAAIVRPNINQEADA